MHLYRFGEAAEQTAKTIGNGIDNFCMFRFGHSEQIVLSFNSNFTYVYGLYLV